MVRDIAIVTMTYNEKRKLPRWALHYARQVSDVGDLYVVDHGSTDGSIEAVRHLNVVEVPRADKLDEGWRSAFISGYTSRLLSRYRYVLYSDVDELVFADPKRFGSLQDYVRVTPEIRNAAAGFDIIHDIDREPDLRPGLIWNQRSRLQLVASMCKPLLISRPTIWAAGFHTSSNPPAFGDLFMMHLRYADLKEGLERLQLTKTIDSGMKHQKLADETFVHWMRSWLQRPVQEGERGLADGAEVRGILESFPFARNDQGVYHFDYGFRSPHLYRIPPAWAGAF